MVEFLFLLLPLAFYSGWRAARRKNLKNKNKDYQISGHFVKGVNYLLSEEPDKALEVFLNYPDIDEYTAETYQLLGNLFRNRGEVDRALRVHQNLIARSNISVEQKNKAMFSLGQDFFEAGMLDRAESVFLELLDNTQPDKALSKPEVCTALRVIYEQTQEWKKAIGVAENYNKLKKNKSSNPVDVKSLIAHYYCELADEALAAGNLHDVELCMSKAKRSNKKSTRLICLEGDILLHKTKYKQSIDKYFLAIKYDNRLLSMLFDKIELSAIEIQGINTVQKRLLTMFKQSNDKSVFEKIVIIAKKYKLSTPVLNDLIIKELSSNTMNIESIYNASAYIKLEESGVDAVHGLKLVNEALASYLQGKPAFNCNQCGYQMRDFLWRCPACHHWDSVNHA